MLFQHLCRPPRLSNPGSLRGTTAPAIFTGYDLAVAKSVSPTTVQVGRQVTFTVVVTNKGPGNASGVRVGDQMTWYAFELDNAQASQGSFSFDVATASGTWNAGSIPAGANATLTIVGYVYSDVTNTAAITNGLGAGDDYGNNEATASVTIQ